MGTRSTYRIQEQIRDSEKTMDICLVYVHYDGYPEGHPLDTAKWLSGGKVVNGITSKEDFVFDGAGCLAAQLIARMKDGPGGVYMNPLGNRGDSGEDYMYDILVKSDGSIVYTCFDYNNKVIFEGSPSEYVTKYDKK